MAQIVVSIGASADDGYWRPPSTFNNNNTSRVYIGGSSNNGFWRFTGLSALHNVTINSAKITFVASGNSSDTSGTYAIRARAVDNGAAPTSYNSVAAAARMPETVTWNQSGTWSEGATYDTPDLTALFQSLSDSGYLASGVATIYVQVASSGQAQREIAPYGHSTYAPAKLTIDYTANTAPTFVSQPTVNHGSGYSHIGPNNPDATVTFTTADAEQSTLSYAVKKGGSTVKSGSVQTGSRSITIAYNDPNLTDGANSLVLEVNDGEGGSATSNAFTVYRDTVAPTAATSISHFPDPVLTEKEYSLTFTPNDATSIGAGQLRYEIWTGAGATGTKLIGPISCTSGASTSTALLTDTELVNGSNTRYIRVRDGAGNWSATPVVITAELKVPQEITVEATGAALVDVAVTVPTLVDVDATGAATIDAHVTVAQEITVEPTGAATVAAHATAPAGIESAIFGGAWVSIRMLPAAYIAADINAWATVDAQVRVAQNITAAPVGSAIVSSGLTAPAGFESVIAGSATVEARASIVPEIVAEIAGSATVEVEVSFRADIEVGIAGRAIVDARLMEYATIGGSGLRADLFSVDGEPLATGPLLAILGASYSAGLDEIGTFEIAVPAGDPALALIDDGTRIRLYRAGEGLLFRGILGPAETIVTPDGHMATSLRGMSLAQELAWASTLVGTEYLNVPMPGVADDLLDGTGWSVYAVASDARNVTAQYTGSSIWQAITHAATMFGWHVRERNLARQIEIGPMGADSGIVLSNVDAVHPAGDMGVQPIAHITITDQQDELWNRVVPLGGGEGINVLTLQYSNRTSPYTIQQGTDRAGNPYWYIEDAASIARHGVRERVLSASDLIPLSNGPAEIRNAANALYDVAAAWLGWHGVAREAYQVDALGLRHIVGGQEALRVGDRARLRYRGVVSTPEGTRVWRDIDQDVWILGYARQFDEDGVDRWSLKLSTVDRETPSDAEVVAKALEDLWAIQTAKRPYTTNMAFGPYTESIDAGASVRFPVRINQAITWLHSAELEVRKARVKSNVKGAAAGGGQTSSASVVVVQGGGGVTSDEAGEHSHAISTTATPAGGGHTSQGGSPHSHTVTGETVEPGGLHAHQIGQYQQTNAWVTPGYTQTLVMQTGPLTGPNYGVIVGRNGVEGAGGSFWTQQNQAHTHQIAGVATQSENLHTHGVLHHTHTVTGQTAISGGKHRHTMPLHSHSVNPHDHEIQDHTHALIYGVFRGPNPTTPQMRLTINGTDRTAELGGPWDNDFVVDITTYLADGQGQPLRGSNIIEIESEQLLDATVTVQALVSLMSVVPVG